MIHDDKTIASQLHRLILLLPDMVVEQYVTLKTPSAMSTLAVKLARESFFGEEVMKKCTPQGKTEYDVWL